MISVIIPVYNAEQTLSACIDSVLAQSLQDFELILADDGSTDQSGEICDAYACRDPRIIARHELNSGPSAARNAALGIAQGDYVTFVDSDDVIHRQYLEVLLRKAEATGADIVQAPYQIVPAGTRKDYTSERLSQPLPGDDHAVELTGEEALLAMLYQKGTANSSPCKLFRRQLLEGVRFPLLYRVYEDLYFLAQVYPLVQKMVCIDLPMYFYFKQASGTLNSLSTQRKDAFDVLCNLEQQYLVMGRKDLVRAVRERRLSVSFNILRLLSQQPHTDANKAMAYRCWTNIRQLRSESIHDSNARLKNRLTALLSYLLTLPSSLIAHH